MINSSMADDLRGATEPDPLPRKGEVPKIPDPPEEEPDIIQDDYPGNLDYLRRKREAAARVARQEEVAEPRSEMIIEAQVENLPQPEENAEEDQVPQPEPELQPEIEQLLQAPGESLNLAGLRQRAYSLTQRRQGRWQKRNRLLIACLLILFLIFAASLWNRKKDEIASVLPAGSKTATESADPFAGVSNHNDATRMRTLTTLANLAAVYHLEQGADLPVSPEEVRLNEENPVSDYFRQALQRYGKSDDLLHDPDGDGSYYGYRSADGLSFTLTARLEDKASNNCSETPCLFEKGISAQDLQIMSIDTAQYK